MSQLSKVNVSPSLCRHLGALGMRMGWLIIRERDLNRVAVLALVGGSISPTCATIMGDKSRVGPEFGHDQT